MSLGRAVEQGELIDSVEFRILFLLQKTGSLTQVAQELGLTQPAVSQRIKRVETRLSVPLIERQGRGVRLTQAGDILATHGEAITGEIEAALQAIEDLRGDRGGSLRIAGFPSASATIIPMLMRKLRDEAPGVSFQYREQEPPEALELLRDGEVDCALIFQYQESEPLPASLKFEPLWIDELTLVAGVDRLNGESVVEFEDFSEDQWIAGCTRCRSHLVRRTKSHGFEPLISQETDNMAATIAMVAAGDSVALVPQLAISAQAVLPEGAATARFKRPELRTIGLVSPETAKESPAVKLAKRLLHGLDAGIWGLKQKGN